MKTIPHATLFVIGRAAALSQLVVVLVYAVVVAVWGPRPASAEALFAALDDAPVAGMLRGDLLLLVLVGLYLGTFPAIYAAIRESAPTAMLASVAAIVIGVILSASTESSFSMWHLSQRFAAAATEAERDALLAAGEAVYASGWWTSTASYVAGVCLQGAGVAVSIVMLRAKAFHWLTAIAGLSGNALDLGQHLLEPFVPGVQAASGPVIGPLYLIWFAMLARDFHRLRRARGPIR